MCPKKLLINWLTRILLWGVGFLGFCPHQFLGEIGDFIPSASDRYSYIVSVPNLYHSLGKGVVQTLREAARRERAKQWEQAMQPHQDDSIAIAIEKEARLKANYKKAKAFSYSKRGTLGWCYRTVAKEFEIPIA